jgi:predicted transcriptional regulator
MQKLLQRLERKAMVRRDRSSFAHQFEAAVSHAEVVGHEVESLADKLTDGSMTPLLMHAVEAVNLTPKERRELRALLGE